MNTTSIAIDSQKLERLERALGTTGPQETVDKAFEEVLSDADRVAERAELINQMKAGQYGNVFDQGVVSSNWW